VSFCWAKVGKVKPITIAAIESSKRVLIISYGGQTLLLRRKMRGAYLRQLQQF
jgi:hypothetical protein